MYQILFVSHFYWNLASVVVGTEQGKGFRATSDLTEEHSHEGAGKYRPDFLLNYTRLRDISRKNN
jgi:hypothetical protein